MCGITGVIFSSWEADVRAAISRMTDALAHRGPDGQGVYVDGLAALGHRRLSIIDLEGGVQPLSNESGTLWITFNGEVYNYQDLRYELENAGHQFRTASDTEVIVHAFEQWGERCLDRLHGMFAFGIWDTCKKTLFLARDRLGIKPLYYLQQDGLFAFASEMQAFWGLKQFSPTVDLQTIDQFLHYQYIPAPLSIFREVHKLQPAHWMSVEGGRAKTPARYWRVRFRPDRSLDENEWLERLHVALADTVTRHLVSDVPFGAFLSGGIDSSTVLGYMSRVLAAPVKAFTIGHRQDDYDERHWAREAAQVCGAEHYEEVVEPDALTLLPKLVRHYGEPFADSSAIPTYYVSRLARRHVKMVLSGDGGDELFAGYHAYSAIVNDHRPARTSLLQAKHILANQARRMGLWPARRLPADSKYDRSAILPDDVRRDLWRPEFKHFVGETRRQFDERFNMAKQEDLLGHLQCFDLENYLPYDNLTKVDIASMYHGLEVRVPLLDHLFVETVCQIPPELRLQPSETGTKGSPREACHRFPGKYLLKRNAERFFSTQFIHRPKRGFEVPIREWFTAGKCGELGQRIVDDRGPLAEWFDTIRLKGLLERARTDRVSAWNAWSLLVLDEWCRQHTARPAVVR